MKTKMPLTRIAMIVVAILIVTAICGSALYELQIVRGDEYADAVEKRYASTQTVNAVRGSILDRNGAVLVSSREVFNLCVDIAKLKTGGDAGAVVSQLVLLAGELGVKLTDTLPIGGTPYTYSSDMSETAAENLQKFIRNMGLANETTARDLIVFFRTEYGISLDLTDAQLRTAAGLIYDAELASMSGNSCVVVYDAELEFVQLIKAHRLEGVSVVSDEVREYHTEYAAHILGRYGLLDQYDQDHFLELGYAMDDKVGKDGVELAFEEYLRGTEGTLVTTATESGRVISEGYSVEPKPGENVVLTIDIGLQEAAEKSLEKTILALREGNPEKDSGTDAEGGAVVVLDLKDNGVLATASYPTFDLANYNENYLEIIATEYQPLFNRATQGTYAPGSTYKMMTAISALERGVISLSTLIDDKGIYTFQDGTAMRCWIYKTGRTHGTIDVVKAIEVSCNYFFYETGNQLGIDALAEDSRKFGLGVPSGVEIYEESGTLASVEYRKSKNLTWNPGDTVQAAIGQSDHLFTPMQLATYVSTLVNSGTRYSAHLLREVKSSDYSYTAYQYAPVVESDVALNEQNLQAVLRGMRQAALSGTPSAVFGSYPIAVGAKTGTAEVNVETSDNGVFVCFAPYDDPEIAVVVVVEKGGSGSQIASIARDVLDYYFGINNAHSTIPDANKLLM